MQQRSRGFLKIIILIVIGLIVLGYFGLNIKDILASPVVKENLSYGWGIAKELWVSFLRTPMMWIYEHLLKFLWNFFLDGIGGLRDGTATSTLMQ